jgi:hypothetical protein
MTQLGSGLSRRRLPAYRDLELGGRQRLLEQANAQADKQRHVVDVDAVDAGEVWGRKSNAKNMGDSRSAPAYQATQYSNHFHPFCLGGKGAH